MPTDRTDDVLTAEERASRNKLDEAIVSAFGDGTCDVNGFDYERWKIIIDRLSARLAAAVAEEREACAMVAEAQAWSHTRTIGGPEMNSASIANAIRNRGMP